MSVVCVCTLPHRALGPSPSPKPSVAGLARLFQSECSALTLVLKRHTDARSIGFHLAVLKLHVELDDFSDSKISQGLTRPGKRGSCRLLPGLRARSDEFYDLVNIFSHDLSP